MIFSEAGEGQENQDVAHAELHPDDGITLLCAIGDGQGGRSGGKVAAEIAVQEVMTEAKREHVAVLADCAFWNRTLRVADTAVLNTASAGYTTLVCLCVHDGVVLGASSGDSIALLISDGECFDLTEGQLKNPPVGSGGAAAMAFRQRLGKEWRLVLMSDGVWKYIGYNTVVAQVRTFAGEELINVLHQRARNIAGGNLLDDFTLIVVDPATKSSR